MRGLFYEPLATTNRPSIH